MTQILSDTDAFVIEQLDDAILCESGIEKSRGKPPHEAQWYAICPCGTCNVKAMCEQRRILAAIHDGWWCDPGCHENHRYDEIRWVPIK